jgi:3-deoxy-D-manno-octulosonic-acid transferase
MLLFYKFGIHIYFLFIYIASFFNKKAKLWINGRRKIIPNSDTSSIWFHFASLGEFEQGRPVLEKVRQLYPDDFIVLTFFSPSGYEIRKNTPLAGAVYYLPLDTAKNAKAFISAIKPKFAVFTKYEYWYYFFCEMHKRQIPVYIISGIFRPGQIFFKWYGKLHREILGFVSYFFVQDEQSEQLLLQSGIKKVSVSGDTRFDRVWENARHPKEIPYINEFKNGRNIFIAGSTWQPDEMLIVTLTSRYPDWKFIIAPHEISEEKINNLVRLLPVNSTFRFSHLTTNPDYYRDLGIKSYQTLIIDNIGMLSSLYQYGNFAYIGGGFGAGIHNTLEAAAFGLPVIFGPNYVKFREAHCLIELKAGFSITDEKSLIEVTDVLVNDKVFYHSAGERAKEYVDGHKGATNSIIDYIRAASQPNT